MSRGTALVTGAGSGIGLATAHAMVASGFSVMLASLEREEPPAMTAGMRYRRSDIADHAALLDEAGPLACLVNCAGVTSIVRGDMLDVTPESFDRVLGLNLRGAFFLTQAVARRMLADAVPAGQVRSIVSVGSVNAEVVGENRADYCLSKAALTMMTKLFATRLARADIAVHEVRPGIIRTAMMSGATARYERLLAEGGVPMPRWGEPADVATAIVTLARGDIPYATGTILDIAGGRLCQVLCQECGGPVMARLYRRASRVG